MNSQIRFSIIDVGPGIKRVIGTYRGPEGSCRLDALFYREANETHITRMRGQAPEVFLDKAAEYFAANRIPLPAGSGQ